VQLWVLVGFHVFIIAMLALDLGIFQRRAHTVGFREAAIWSIVWIVLALAFALGIWKTWPLWNPDSPDEGADKALAFLAGYLVEKGLSVDNLFIFLVIFRYFAVPAHLQHRVLYWGILGAVLFRAALIIVGAALLSWFHWMTYIFGVVLLYTAYKLLVSAEKEIDPGRNPVLRIARRLVPVLPGYEPPRFFARHEGRWHATPLFLVLLVIESMDVVFAVDSIPAIFGITRDPFIVYTSNIFAILGLRALYFLLAGFLGMLRYLNVGLAAILAFVSVKMLGEDLLKPYLAAYGIGEKQLIGLSLAVIAVILGVTVLASVVVGRRDPVAGPAKADATDRMN
jgi:tellurite resistance protein TerC